MNRITRCVACLIIVAMGVLGAIYMFVLCTVDPMLATGGFLVGPKESWLQQNTQLTAWRPRNEFAACNYEFCRQGTLLLPFYEITFVHGTDTPMDSTHMHLETTDVKPRRLRIVVGLMSALLGEGLMVSVLWILIRRRREQGVGRRLRTSQVEAP